MTSLSLSSNSDPGDFSQNLLQLYQHIKDKIQVRIRDFIHIGKTGTSSQLFQELCFCLFTPQSSARACWAAVSKLEQNNLLLQGTAEEMYPWMKGVRFHITKAKRVVEVRSWYQSLDLRAALLPLDQLARRNYILNNVKGLGMKEASHFLRNIGMGLDLAILDRHIFRRMQQYQVINKIPETISTSLYLEFESKLQKFSSEIEIPISDLDLLFWFESKQEIFK